MAKVTVEALIVANELGDEAADQQPDYWFDLSNGEIVTDDSAQPVAQYSGRLVLLAELVAGSEFPVSKGEFKTKYRRWADSDLLSLGRLAVFLARRFNASHETDDAITLTKEQLDRLNLLGIAPAYNTFETRFKTIDAFREMIGARIVKRKNKFEDWSTQDFVEYAAGIAERLGRKPRLEDYQAADGPSPGVIRRRVGSLRRLNDFLGYPNVHSMSQADIVVWGVRFAETNNGLIPSQDDLIILSKRKRGPSDRVIAQRFNGLENFQQAVLNALRSKSAAKRRAHEVHGQRVIQYRRHSLLPEDFDDLPQSSQEGIVGKLTVLQRCIPGRHSSFYRQASSTNSHRFIGLIQQERPGMSAASIELLAMRENAFNAIWPVELYADHLRLVA